MTEETIRGNQRRTLSGYGALAGNLALPLLVVLMSVVTGVIEPRFWSSQNLLSLSRQMAPLLIVSVGQSYAVISGGLDLSVSAALALSGVYGVIAMNHFGLAAGLGVMAATGLAFGAVNGFVITFFQVSPFIVTLGMLSVGRGLALMATGGQPIYDMPDAFIRIFGDGTVLGIPAPAIIGLLTIMVGAILLRRTVFGRYVYAIGSNSAAAYNSGVNVGLYTWLVYCLSGLTAGIGAIALTSWVTAAQPLAASGLELQSLAAVVVGGIALTGGSGSMLNAFFGVMILGVLSNSLNMIGVSSFMQTLIIGLVIVIAVIVDRLRRGRVTR
jgi:ribose transport system permease protein